MTPSSDPESTQNRPLEGIRVLTTRPHSEVDLLKQRLEQLGAEVVNHPVIEFAPADDGPLQTAKEGLNEQRYSMLVFLSRRAVSAAESILAHEPSVPIAAIGPGTAEFLRELGHQVALLPEQSNSPSMAAALIGYAKQQQCSKPMLVLRGDRGSDVLPQALSQAEIPFAELVVYRSFDLDQADPKILEEVAAGNFDWLTVSSSSIATSAARLFGTAIVETKPEDNSTKNASMKVASISPTTSKAARESGLSISAEATDYNAVGLAEAIAKYEAGDRT